MDIENCKDYDETRIIYNREVIATVLHPCFVSRQKEEICVFFWKNSKQYRLRLLTGEISRNKTHRFEKILRESLSYQPEFCDLNDLFKRMKDGK